MSTEHKMKTFTNDFPHADIHESLSSDLMHQIIKGSFKYHLLLFKEQVHICSPCDDQPSAKGLELSEGAYMLVILSIPIVIVFASLLVLN